MKKYKIHFDVSNYTTYEFQLFEKYLGVSYFREKFFGNNLGVHIPEKMDKSHISYHYYFL